MRDTTWATRPLHTIERHNGPWGLGRPAARGVALLGLLLSLLGPALAGAEPVPLAARVVWVRQTHVYVAARDSLPLAPGDLVTFSQGSRAVASGVVERVLDPHLAMVTLRSGSLTRVKKPDRLRVLAERPAPRPAPLLRVGYPAVNRARAHPACERLTLRLPLPDGAYRTAARSDRTERLVRDRAVPVEAPWPDTLEIQLFDEITDQEIALERGELEVAVFWPGELSRHMREQPRWADPPLGTWAGAAADSTAAEPIRCPVLCEARLLPMLRAIGPEVLVNLLACPSQPGEP